MKHRWYDLLDWMDRNADILMLAAVLGLLFLGVGMCAGSPDDGRGYIAAPSSPSGAVAVPGSPVSGGVEPGAARTPKVQP
jgi:hypothetical protein